MEESELIEYVKNRLQEPGCYAHDIGHIMRVYENAKWLHEKEGGDWSVIGPAALLHDIARETEDYMKGKSNHAEEGANVAKELGFNEQVQNCIRKHSSWTGDSPNTIEEKIIWDADKLESFGAIGLARWFIMEGEQNHNETEAAERYITACEKAGMKEVSVGNMDELINAWLFTDSAKQKGKEDAIYAIEFCRKVLE